MIAKRSVACAVGILLLASCGSADDTPTNTSTIPPSTTSSTPAEASTASAPDALPLIIDTDASLDDVMAILYLLRRPDVDILAVTVSGTGVAHCDAGVEIALGVLAVSGVEDVPVACGPEAPLEGTNAFPAGWRDGMDAFAASGVLPPGGSPDADTASDVIARVAAASTTPPMVLALGPHTNVAQSLRDHPDLEQQLRGVHMMGGAITADGNTFDNPRAEWNLWIDPVADAEVLNTGLPVWIVPLDATNFVPLTAFFADQLAEHLTTPEARAVHDLLLFNPDALVSGQSFWDQFAAVSLMEPDVASWEALEVTVLQGGGPESAGTLAAGMGRPADVAMRADRQAFESEFLSTLCGESVEASEWETDAIVTVSNDGWKYEGPDQVEPGPFTAIIDNRSEHQLVAVHGRLTEGATWKDLEAYTSIEQPPFLEVEGFALADPRIESIWNVDFSIPGQNVLVGLDLTDEVVAWRYTVTVDG
jgi:inosine-uridine nucleoside N-ribohydrolase